MLIKEPPCPRPPDVIYADRVGDDVIFGAEVAYYCQAGMRMEDGRQNRTITCELGGKWSSDTFTCSGNILFFKRSDVYMFKKCVFFNFDELSFV